MVGRVKICSTVRHEGEITCLLFNNNVLYSGSEDGTVKLWDTELHSKRELNAHAALIYAMTMDSKGRLLTSSTDGLIKIFENPRSSDFSQELTKSFDELYCLIHVNDDVYCGDDKGNVTWFVDGKEKMIYNVAEEVRDLAVENNLIYTIRDKDCVVSERTLGSDNLVTKATIPGRYPMVLCGKKPQETHEFIVFCTRDGKGIVLVDNYRAPGEKSASFSKLWSKDNCHEMIINALHGTDKYVFTGGFDGKVKKWELDEDELILVGEADVGCCVNSIVDGPEEAIYVGGADGAVREVVFE